MPVRVLLLGMHCNLCFDSHSRSIPCVRAYYILCIKYVYCRCQNNDQYVRLIPKRDPGIGNSIPGL